MQLQKYTPERPFLGLGSLLLLAVAAYGFFSMLPDLKRYMRIKEM